MGFVTVIRPSTPAGVVEAVVSMLDRRPGRVRLAVDGAPAAEPGRLAALVAVGLSPRPALHVRADHFWRPASLRLENGRHNPDSWLDSWLDDAALRREALDSFLQTGRVLPSLRDPETDRSTRGTAVELPGNALLIVSGSVLLGRNLPFDLAIHLHMSSAALERRTPPDQAWTLPALARYSTERHPDDLADLVVRLDDPRHPALATAD
jgi:hypothetical protein